MLDDNKLHLLLTSIKTIAVIGLSPDPAKISFQVASYLRDVGYNIIPINPNYPQIFGKISYPDLKSAQRNLPEGVNIDVVQIFRRSEDVFPHIEEAIAIGAKIIWMQEGIEHIDGARKARTAGLTVIMNRCMMKEHKRLIRKE